MEYITLRKSISQADYMLLQNSTKDKLCDFCYWAAKFCTGYPVEGYGLYNPRIENVEKYKYEIVWECKDNCD